MKRVLAIYKKTTLQRYGENDPTIKDLLARNVSSVAVLMEAHEAHLKTIERAKAALRDLGVKATFRHRLGVKAEAWDLVLTLGGDGTLLWASHQVDDQTPMVAINSAPTSSVGYFCAGDGDDVAEILDSALSGKLRATKLTRMRVELDGEEHSRRVLNDILFCHRVPAATTRYIIHHGDAQESHTSSGVWAGPAAGSTAAQRSAGGKILPIGSRKIQWVVREPYRPDDMPLALSRGLVAPDEHLMLKSKTRNGRLYMVVT